MNDEKEMTLREATKKFLRFGVTRVMISESEAVPPIKARKHYGIEPTVIFIRNDGWTLGAPDDLIMPAYNTWPEDWRFFIKRPSTRLQPISEFKT
jgi:hypothetical protein